MQFEVKPEEGSFYIHLDKEQLWTEGQKLIRNFLIILQAYKSTGCVERANKFWAHYSKVEGLFLKIRDIVIDKKKPRRIELNNNLIRYKETCIEPIVYPERMEAIIHSFADRYPATRALCEQVIGEWDHRREYLRVPLP